MLTFGMGGSAGGCTAIDIKWVLKVKKIKFNPVIVKCPDKTPPTGVTP